MPRFEPTTASGHGTPRSSLDLYAASNNSTETLVSEYIAPAAGPRALRRAVHSRQQSRLSPLMSPNATETIMMGHVQLVGSFTLDGALVDFAPFEPIKRRGVIGGQGGGGGVGGQSSVGFGKERIPPGLIKSASGRSIRISPFSSEYFPSGSAGNSSPRRKEKP